jgi:hypothetical protein
MFRAAAIAPWQSSVLTEHLQLKAHSPVSKTEKNTKKPYKSVI